MGEYKTGKERAMDALGGILGELLEVSTPLLTPLLKAIDPESITGLINKVPTVGKLLKADLDADALGLVALLKNEELIKGAIKLVKENEEVLAKYLPGLYPSIITEICNGNPKMMPAIIGDIHPELMEVASGLLGITNEFVCPHIIFGKDALERSRKFLMEKGKKAVIVTDKGVVDLGYVETVKDMLEGIGYEVNIFDEVEPDPQIPTVEKGGEMMQEFGPDWIIALGGGSCMDAAKGMWIKYANPGAPLTGINPLQEYRLRENAHFMAIPTTSGTGADATWAVVLTDPEAKRKIGMGSKEVVADVSVLDTRFPSAMPKKLTAGTGLDVLAHALGGYVSSWRNDFADAMCLHGARLALKYLPRAYKNPDDMEAREKMHNAATIAGIGFGNSQVTLEHSVGHAVGSLHHLHHGLAVGIALPYTIQFYAKEEKAREMYAELASGIGIGFKDGGDAVDKIVEKVRALMAEVEAPKSYSETEIKEEDWKRYKKDVMEVAYYDSCYFVSPRVPSIDELDKILDCCWAGRDVTF